MSMPRSPRALKTIADADHRHLRNKILGAFETASARSIQRPIPNY